MTVEETEVKGNAGALLWALQRYVETHAIHVNELLKELQTDCKNLRGQNVRLKKELAERPAIDQEVKPTIWINPREPEWHFTDLGRWTLDLTDLHARIARDLDPSEDGELQLEGQTKLVGKIRDNMLTFHIEEK